MSVSQFNKEYAICGSEVVMLSILGLPNHSVVSASHTPPLVGPCNCTCTKFQAAYMRPMWRSSSCCPATTRSWSSIVEVIKSASLLLMTLGWLLSTWWRNSWMSCWPCCSWLSAACCRSVVEFTNACVVSADTPSLT